MKREEQKALTRQRILCAAGRGFRQGGFGGTGVDGLAKQAGVTSGAFYTHFASKEAAFEQAVLEGVDELRRAVAALQQTEGARWAEAFIDFYLQDKRLCDLGESCALQSLVPELGRAGASVRKAVETPTREVARVIADGLTDDCPAERLAKAWALLALLSGGVSLARASNDPAHSDVIAQSIATAARSLLSIPS